MTDLKTALQLIDQTLAEFPNTNQDGTPNQAAQDAAVKGVIDSAASSGVVDIASFGITLTQLEAFAKAVCPVILAYEAATKRPSLP